MTVIENQTPPSRRPQAHPHWRDGLVTALTSAVVWFGLCWLVAWLAR
jgi:hypothetical protein